MHTYFKIKVNKLDSFNYQDLLPEEIDVLLNQEMFKIIEQRAYGTNPKRTGVEETQKRVDDLRNITLGFSNSVFTTSALSKPNGSFVTLPADYRHALQEDCLITYTDCNGDTQTEVVPTVPMSHDRYDRIVWDPFNKPFEELVARLPYQANSFELVTDGTYTLTAYNLRYLRTPVSMQYGSTYAIPSTDVNCELSEHIHREIVESAALTALENVESPRIRTYPSLERDTE